ncbi:MAG: protein translocase subunit SecF [Acidimicrobiia bacterium]
MLRVVRDLYYVRTNYRIVERRHLFYLASTVLVLGSIVAVLTLGLELSIDFKGGTSWKLSYTGTMRSTQSLSEGEESQTASAEARRTGAPSESQVREAVSRGGVAAEKILYLGGSQIEVQAAPVDSETADNVSRELAALVGEDPSSFQKVVSVASLSPTWGAQISRKALRALVVFLAAVSVYISLRFQWRMALAALVALAHDIIITIGTYAVTRFTVAPATVIATLTILGYTLYDDVVVFDRVKEAAGSPEAAKQNYSDLVNRSLNQVLMRSLNTSLTALLPVSALLISGIALGVPSLKDFALALFVGILAGTYSSIFLASPLLVTLGRQRVRAVGLSQAKERALAEAKARKVATRAGQDASIKTKYRSGGALGGVAGSGSAREVTEVAKDVEDTSGEGFDEGDLPKGSNAAVVSARAQSGSKPKKKGSQRSVSSKGKGKSKAKRKRR